MLDQGPVVGLPPVELDLAEEALRVVGRVESGLVVEAGAGELGDSISMRNVRVRCGIPTSSMRGDSCGHSTLFAPFFFLLPEEDARRLLSWCGCWKVARRAANVCITTFGAIVLQRRGMVVSELGVGPRRRASHVNSAAVNALALLCAQLSELKAALARKLQSIHSPSRYDFLPMPHDGHQPLAAANPAALLRPSCYICQVESTMCLAPAR